MLKQTSKLCIPISASPLPLSHAQHSSPSANVRKGWEMWKHAPTQILTTCCDANFVWRSRRAGEPKLLTGIPQNNIYKETQGKLKPLTANPWKETSQELNAETNFQTASIQLSWEKHHVRRSTERGSCGSKDVVKWSIWWVCGMGFRVPHVLKPQH